LSKNDNILIPRDCEFKVSTIYGKNEDGSDDWITKTVFAKTHSAAKYQFYLSCCDWYNEGFSEFQKGKWRINKIGKPTLKSLYGSAEGLAETCKYRIIAFVKLGMKVHLTGFGYGYVVGKNSAANLDVYFPDRDAIDNCHPYWELDYFDEDDKLIKSYKKDK